jgi:hypothetical protein
MQSKVELVRAGATTVGGAVFPISPRRLSTVVVLANQDPPAEACAASKAVALVVEKARAAHRASP